MSDLEAIRRLKEGDIGGLEALVSRYQDQALRAAYLILQDEPMAEDVVQDTFIRVFQYIHQFDEQRPFAPYLMRSVVNAALNAAKRQSRKAFSLDGESPEDFEALMAHAISVEGEVERAQARETILEALGKLPPRQRAVIVQRYYLEMSEQEIVASLGAPPGTIRWLLSAARTRLRDIFSQKGGLL